VVDNSLKEAAPEKDWLDKAVRHFALDVFMIMLGSKLEMPRRAQGTQDSERTQEDEVSDHRYRNGPWRRGSS